MFILTKTKLELYAKLAEQPVQTQVVEGASPFSSQYLKPIIKGKVIPFKIYYSIFSLTCAE